MKVDTVGALTMNRVSMVEFGFECVVKHAELHEQ